MRGTRHRLLLSGLTAMVLAAICSQVLAAPRVALVIGNASYAHAPALANPLNDMADVGAAFGRLGFEVTRLENADQASLRRGLQEFALAASASEVAVVFYAGHGIEVDQRNFLVPVDARLASDQDVEFEAVPLELVQRAVERASRLRLVLLDACRENPFAMKMQRSGATRSIGRGLARASPPGGTFVCVCGEGRNVGGGRCGPEQSLQRGAARASGGAGTRGGADVSPGARCGTRLHRRAAGAVLVRVDLESGDVPRGEARLGTRAAGRRARPRDRARRRAGDGGAARGRARVLGIGEGKHGPRGAARVPGALSRGDVRGVGAQPPAAPGGRPGTARAVAGRGPHAGGAPGGGARVLDDGEGEHGPGGASGVSGPLPRRHIRGAGAEPAEADAGGGDRDGGCIGGWIEGADRGTGGERGCAVAGRLGPRGACAGRAGGVVGSLAQGAAAGPAGARVAGVRAGAGGRTVRGAHARCDSPLSGREGVRGDGVPECGAVPGAGGARGGFGASEGRGRTPASATRGRRCGVCAGEDAGTAEAYEAYLEAYPAGRHVAQARRLRTEAERLERERREKAPGRRFRDCEGCPELVVVGAGSYMMGSPDGENGRRDDEGPVHRVRIAESFAVGVYEVTFAEWDACRRDGGCSHNPGDLHGWGRGNRPVINVNWEGAREYVAWLSRKTGERYRLPSESEWEYVARAGTTTPFHYGATVSTEQANYDGRYAYGSGRKGRSRSRTVPVGSFPANAFGLHDVHGNVWEWVEDCWNEGYAGAPSNGSAWEGRDCTRRVLRGGSWFDLPRVLRSAFRSRFPSGDRLNNVGFRVARALN